VLESHRPGTGAGCARAASGAPAPAAADRPNRGLILYTYGMDICRAANDAHACALCSRAEPHGPRENPTEQEGVRASADPPTTNTLRQLPIAHSLSPARPPTRAGTNTHASQAHERALLKASTITHQTQRQPVKQNWLASVIGVAISTRPNPSACRPGVRRECDVPLGLISTASDIG
jgi:hypothetical protein